MALGTIIIQGSRRGGLSSQGNNVSLAGRTFDIGGLRRKREEGRRKKEEGERKKEERRRWEIEGRR